MMNHYSVEKSLVFEHCVKNFIVELVFQDVTDRNILSEPYIVNNVSI